MQNVKRFADEKGKLEYNKQPIVILTHDIPKYFDEENIFYINFWVRYKRHGSPWSVGWSNWPWWAMKVLDILDGANEKLNGSK